MRETDAAGQLGLKIAVHGLWSGAAHCEPPVENPDYFGDFSVETYFMLLCCAQSF